MTTGNGHEAILQAATELFYKKGYQKTSIRDIAAKAKISTALVYHHFKDKEDVLFQIVHGAGQEFLDGLVELDATIPDPLECLEQMLWLYLNTRGHKRLKQKIVMEEGQFLSGKRRQALRQQQRAIYDLYLKKLNELAARGYLRDLDTRVLCFSLIAVIRATTRWHKESGSLSNEDVAKNILGLLFHGLLNPEAIAAVKAGSP